MDDLTITRLCAEAMGWRAFKETCGNFTLCVAVAKGERMPWEGHRGSDPKRYTEVTLAEAQKIGFFGRQLPTFLTNDAQCFALVKRFRIKITNAPKTDFHRAVIFANNPQKRTLAIGQHPSDLNRAICTAVANMQEAKR